MPRGVKKENLPTKICVTCNRPFTWRKKWERCWDEVTTCSKSCNRKRKDKAKQSKTASTGSTHEPNNEVKVNMESLYLSDVDEVDLFDLIRQDLRLEHDARSEEEGSTSAPDDTSSISAGDTSSNASDDTKAKAKAERKAAKKAMKAARRARREGRGDPSAGQKPCDMCGKSVNLLIRCTYDASGEWKMVCGKCWNSASGGVVDGDAQHPHYRYGGLWKNRRAK